MTTHLTQSRCWHKGAPPVARLQALSLWQHPLDGESPSEVAGRFRVSRQTLYRWRERAVDALSCSRPGPDPAELHRRRLERRVEELQARCGSLESRCRDLEAQLAQSVRVTWTRVWAVVMVCAVCPVSLRDIRRILAQAFGEAWVPSLGQLSQKLNHFGQLAAHIMARARQEVGGRIRSVLADEIFFGDPVLAAVEPHSAACLSVEPMSTRDGESWAALLGDFPNLTRVIADMGKGLRRGAELVGAHHGADNFHEFKLWREGVLRRLEDSATAALSREDAAERSFMEATPAQAEPAWQEVEVSRRQTAAALDALEKGLRAFEAFRQVYQPLTADGRLKTREQASDHVDAAIHELRALTHRGGVLELIKHLQTWRDHFTLYLEAFDDIPVHLNKGAWLSPRLALCLASQILFWRRRLKANVWADFPAWRAARRRLAALQRRLHANVRCPGSLLLLVDDALRFPERSSSLIEALNSRLRALQQVIQRPGAQRLALVALDYNLRPRAPNNRRGTDSPYRQLGVSFALNRPSFVSLILAEAQRAA